MNKPKTVDEIIDATNKKDVSRDVSIRIAYSEGIDKAIYEITEWIDLLNLSHAKITQDNGYLNQKEAEREHRNQINVLESITFHLAGITSQYYVPSHEANK